MPKRILESSHKALIRREKQKEPTAYYAELSEALLTKFNVNVAPSTIGNYWRAHVKNTKRNSKKDFYIFKKIVSYRFITRKGKLIRKNPLFKIKWKDYDKTTEIKETEFVHLQDLMSYLID